MQAEPNARPKIINRECAINDRESAVSDRLCVVHGWGASPVDAVERVPQLHPLILDDIVAAQIGDWRWSAVHFHVLLSGLVDCRSIDAPHFQFA